MTEVWVYTISFYSQDDEYEHRDLIDTWVEVFPSYESALRYKQDFEETKNLQYISDYKLFCWYNLGHFVSSIEKKEILDY